MSILESFNHKDLDNEWRFYSFTNMYLSSIQKGIQTAHAVSEMTVDLTKRSKKQKKMYKRWAAGDKTVIVLNGGNQKMLNNIYSTFKQVEADGWDFPFTYFNEDEDSLNGALTAVAILLPKCVYEVASYVRSNRGDYPDGVVATEAERAFINVLNSCGLAN